MHEGTVMTAKIFERGLWVAALGALLSVSTPAGADPNAANYRNASDAQRLAYIEKVLGETRFKKESPERFRALAVVGKACVDEWDPKYEPVFLEHLASCLVMANRKVKANP
jgi:hypothetical protein